MDWTDQAIVLSAKKHGEHAAIVHLLTREYGIHAGLVRGGAGRRQRPIFQPGNLVHAHWRARLPEHLGTLTCEPDQALGSAVLHDAARLACVGSASTLLLRALPEREPHGVIFDGLLVLLRAMRDDGPSEKNWPSVYVKWELGLLQELGYGLDFTQCAATGVIDDLIYVSPKSGAAVSREAGRPYHDRLLPLPNFLLDGGAADSVEAVLLGLRLTGYFLDAHVLGPAGGRLPDARIRLLHRLDKKAA